MPTSFTIYFAPVCLSLTSLTPLNSSIKSVGWNFQQENETETKQDHLGGFNIYYSRIGRLALGNFLWEGLGRRAIYSKPSGRKAAWNLRRWAKFPVPVLLFVAFIIEAKTWHFWRPLNLGGICATAYPADCSQHHTPLAFYKTPSLSPCRPLHTALIVHWEDSAGKRTMRSIHHSPWAVYFALALNYTVQV